MRRNLSSRRLESHGGRVAENKCGLSYRGDKVTDALPHRVEVWSPLGRTCKESPEELEGHLGHLG